MPSKKRNFKCKKPRWNKEQIQFLIEWYGKISLDKISQYTNKTYNSIKYKAMSLGLKYKFKKGETEESIREKLDNSHIKIKQEYIGDIQSKFECPICGKIFLALPSHIFCNQIKSCGCNADYSNKRFIQGTKEIPKTYFSSLKRGAFDRQIEFNISIEYISKLLVEQDFKCALTGLEINIGYPILKVKTASLDRIDNTKGYIEGNVWWVHKHINVMKWSHKLEDFIRYCKLIAEKN